MALPWIEKYRPNTLEDIVDHTEKIKVLQKFVEKGQLPHLLFYGSAGCGKTSTILAIAKTMYSPQEYRRHVLELNASNERGIDVIRELPNFITNFSIKPKLIILDEADALTIDAQNALRRIIEKYSIRCSFCLICNIVNKIIPGLQSRCAKMFFRKVSSNFILEKLKFIVSSDNENISITEEALLYLSNLNKDFRQILNCLQCIAQIHDGDSSISITVEEVKQYLGIPTDVEMSDFLENIYEMDIVKCLEYGKKYFMEDNKYNINEYINELIKFIIDIYPQTQNEETKDTDTADGTTDTADIIYVDLTILKDFSDILVQISQCHNIEVQIYNMIICLKDKIKTIKL